MADAWDEFDKAPAADPWAEFQAAPKVPAATPPSAAASFGRGAAQGATLGFGDEIRGAIQAALPPVNDTGTAANYLSGFGERYRRERDAARKENQAAQEAHPALYATGNVVGGLAPTVLMPGAEAAEGASLGARAVAGAKAALPLGALAGAGGSEAGSLPGLATDTAKGALSAAAVGAGLPLATAAAGKVLAPVREYLGDKAIELGRKAITGVGSPLARKAPLAPEVVENAFQQGAIKPLSNVEGIASRLRDVADVQGDRYQEVLKSLADAGVHGPQAEQLATQLAADASEASQNSIIGTRAAALRDAADALSSKALPVSGRGRLGLMQAEEMKRELQTAAANDFVKEGAQSLAGSARKELAGRWREAIEQAVQDQADKAPEAAAAFEPAKNQLHLTLSALGPASEAAARMARRSPFGLHEAMGLASGIASGNQIEAAVAPTLMHAIKERGASTAAWLARQGAEGIPEEAVNASRLPLSLEMLRRLQLAAPEAAAEQPDQRTSR